MNICENCGIEHSAEYGSGRFCSSRCARGFSTKKNRKEINKKVSTKLTGFGHLPVTLVCKYCGKEFKKPWSKRKTVCCSIKCDRNLRWLNDDFRFEFGKTISKIRANGNFKFSFNNKKSNFVFNDMEIRCDSDLERKGLVKIIEKYKVKILSRSGLFITYIFENKKHTFNPDFIFETDSGHRFILECKTRISKNSTNKNVRPYYFLTNESKKMAMIEYANANNYSCLWFDGSVLEEISAPLAQ